MVYFDLDQSDYVTAGRRDADLPGPFGKKTKLDPTYRVIEMRSLGTKVRNTKRFYVLNPTVEAYSFEFVCEDGPRAEGAGVSRCLTTKGVIQAGRKVEMVFEYTPTHTQLVESVLRFRILDFTLWVPGLLKYD
eukprot:786308_1